MHLTSYLFPLLLTTLHVSTTRAISSDDLPTVDLGYVHQRATSHNETTGVYTYKNIRYARPPLGDLRFRKPQSPMKEPNGTISDGSQYNTTICPQIATDIVSGITPSDRGFSEDCLFLDVYVPGQVKPGSNVPVLLWIYGGGYAVGSKEDIYMFPTGLIRAAKKPVIFVAINYRLGALGWLSPPSESSITPNVGFYDAEAALGWVKEYIHLFGGNKDDVTVFGESAGGGIIMNLITAYGGKKAAPLFHKAVLQSPGFIPVRGNMMGREIVFKSFMTSANCSDLACLRQAPTDVIMKANAFISSSPSNTTIGIGPVVDGDYVPDLPSKLLVEGRFHKDVIVVAANNEHEGRFFVPSPDNVTQDTFEGVLSTLLPNITDSDKAKIRDLYLDPSTNETIYDRTVAIFSDVLFDCNVQAIASSFAAVKGTNKAFRYIFAVPPGAHGDDGPYTFYSQGDNPYVDAFVTNTTVASALQNIITSLAFSDVPKWGTNQTMTAYGAKGNTLIISNSTIHNQVGDPYKNQKCEILGKGLYTQG